MQFDEHNTYTIPPEVSEELEKAFTPLVKELRHRYMRLTDWLPLAGVGARTDTSLPPNITLRLAHTLNYVLASHPDLLDALDHLAEGSGHPALLIHGLPKESEVSPLIYEAFRQRLFPDPQQKYVEAIFVRHVDAVNSTYPWGFEARGHTKLHQDDGRVGFLFGVRAGSNPRNTCVITLPEFIEDIAATAHVEPEIVRQLLAAPIWCIDVPPGKQAEISKQQDAYLKRNAIARGVARQNEEGTWYAPLLSRNPHYNSAVPGSQHYEILHTPFGHLGQRLGIGGVDRASVPEALEPYLNDVIEAAAEVIKKPRNYQRGPVLDSGDVLVYNNHQVLHAGGAYKHRDFRQEVGPLSKDLPAREVVALDAKMRSPDTCHARITQPIQYDGKKQMFVVDPSIHKF